WPVTHLYTDSCSLLTNHCIDASPRRYCPLPGSNGRIFSGPRLSLEGLEASYRGPQSTVGDEDKRNLNPEARRIVFRNHFVCCSVCSADGCGGCHRENDRRFTLTQWNVPVGCKQAILLLRADEE